MRIFLNVWRVLTALACGLALLLALLVCGVRLVGLRPFAVVSGSMEPEYRVGSLVYIRAVEPSDIEVGDTITFVMNKELDVATHRVVAISDDAKFFTTRGDANSAPDSDDVYYKNIIGSPVFAIPLLGYLTSALATPFGTVLAILIILALVVVSFVPDFVRGDRRRPLSRRARHRKSA